MKKTFTRCMAWLLILFMLASDSQVQVFASTLDTHVHTEDADTDETHVHTEDEETPVEEQEPDVTDGKEGEETAVPTETPTPEATPVPEEPVEDETESDQADSDAEEVVEELTQVQKLLQKIDEILMKYLGAYQMSEENVQNIILDMEEDTFIALTNDVKAVDELKIGLQDSDLVDCDVSHLDTYVCIENVLTMLNEPEPVTVVSNILGGKLSISDSLNKGSSSDGLTYTCSAAKGTLSGSTNTITIKNESAEMLYISFDFSRSGGGSCSLGDKGTKKILLSAGEATSFTLTGGGVITGDAKLTLSNFSAITLEDATTAYYMVDSELYDDLNKAIEAVQTASKKTIVLMSNGTLPAGTYTIPSGATLLIPFDAANTCYTTTPGTMDTGDNAEMNQWELAGGLTEYRTLTMDTGANLIINGSLSLSNKVFAAHSPAPGAGSPIGNVSFIRMNTGSNITINSGGNLYAWGYITGNGSVTAKNGATVYECFQISDWRGGSQATNMKNRVFPMSQYYVQNIEVPLTIEYGAVENAYSAVHMKIVGATGTSVGFFGKSNAMFQLGQEGSSITKRYDGSTDRLIVEVNGIMNIAPMDLQMPNAIGSMVNLNSADYELQINSNITVQVNAGGLVNISQNVAMLPGSKIIVNKDATVKVAPGTSIYIYDTDQWGGYAGTPNRKLITIPYAPGKTYNRTEADLVDAEIKVDGYVNATEGYVYTTASGANIYSTGTGGVELGTPGTDTVTYQLVWNGDNSTYPEIPVTPFKLKNADGTYFETSGLTTGTVTYRNGKWHKPGCAKDTETVITSATCTASGSKEVGCDCYQKTTVTIEALGHKIVTDQAVAATCENPGLTEGKHCDRCSYVEKAQETTKALGHDRNEKVITAATCLEDGEMQVTCKRCTKLWSETINAVGKHTPGEEEQESKVDATCQREGSYKMVVRCTKCNEELSSTSHTITKIGHNEVTTIQPFDATCTTPGRTKESECSMCQTKLSVSQEIPALGHDIETIEKKDATCTTKGYEAGKRCKRTGCSYVIGLGEISALGHDSNSTKTENNEPATCTTGGSYDTVASCSRCGAEQSRVTTTTDPLGHQKKDPVQENYNAATCYADGGYDMVVYCERCKGIVESNHTTIKKETVDHKPAAAVKENIEESTCSTQGSYDSVVYCSVTECKAEINRTKDNKLPLKEHTPETDEAVAPTCTEKGKTEGSHCSVCEKIIISQNDVDATGHTEVKDLAVEATCQKEGMTEGLHCSVCGEVTKPQTSTGFGDHKPNIQAPTCTMDQVCTVCKKIIKTKTGHTEEPDEAVAPTCTDAGLTEGKHCSVCKEVLSERKPVEALGHNLNQGTVTTIADCDSAGVKTYKCQRENCTYTKTEPIEALGHNRDKKLDAVPATCTDDGLTVGWACSRCNAVQVAQQKEDKLGHNPNISAATCETAQVCLTCNATIKPALNHKWDNGVVTKEATCTEDGIKTYTCQNENCEKKTKTEPIVKLSHTEVSVKAVEATCTTLGKTEGKQCRVCKTWIEKQQDIPKKPHTEVVDEAVAPTCEKEGLTEGKHCSVCDNRLIWQAQIRPIGHKWDEGKVTTDPTCTTKGVKTYTCQNDSAHTKTEDINANGHAETTIPAVEATCENAGLTAGVKCSVCGTIITEPNPITAKGHKKGTPVEEERVESTCTTAGQYYEVTYCTVEGCNKQLDRVFKTLKLAEHTPGEPTRENELPATCTADGHYEEVVYCTAVGCGYEISRVEKPIVHEGHKPNIEKATCEANQICTVCETVLEKALGHDYKEEVNKAPTCTEKGYSTFTCKNNCGSSYENDTDALGHLYAYTDKRDATCTEAGYAATAYCIRAINEKGDRCGDTVEGATIPALGHKWDKGTVTEAATCSKEGTIVYKCTRDNCTVEDKKSIDKLLHTEVIDPAVPATCTTDGLTAGKHCSVCNTVTVKPQKVDKTGHKETPVAGKAATCSATGLTDGKWCSVCLTWTVPQETIEKLPHTEVTDPAVAATCETSGLSEGSHCSVCKKIIIAQFSTRPIQHKWDEGSVTTEPTCTGTGVKTYTCQNDSNHTKTEKIDANGHKDDITLTGTPATCTTDGLTDGVKCSTCGVITTPQTKIDALGHKKGTAATCTTAQICTICEDVLVPALGHDWDKGVETTPATCQKEGIMTYTCNRCKTPKTEPIDQKPHTPTTILGYAATCTTDGKKDGTQCKVCKTWIKEQETIKATGHTEVTDPAIAATCETPGLTEGKHCSVCNKLIIGQLSTRPIGHKWDSGKETKPATCTGAGVKTYTCQNDTKHTKTEPIDAKGHDNSITLEAKAETCENTGLTEGKQCKTCGLITTPQNVVNAKGHTPAKEPEIEDVTPATCLKAGGHYEVIYCTVAGCGKQISRNFVTDEALGHDPEKDTGYPATCLKAGLTDGSHCKRCEEILEHQTTINKLDHVDEIDPAVPATCTEDGKTEGKHCKVCKTVILPQTKVEAKGHTPVKDLAVAAKCESTGLTEGSHCSVCNKTIVKQETVKALGHDPVTDEAVAAKCESTGLTKGSHCKRCLKVLEKQETVNALGHDPVEDAAVPATCVNTGLGAGSHCKRCEKIIETQAVLPALGHDMVADKAVTATCTKTGLTAGSHCSRCSYATIQQIVPAKGHTPKKVLGYAATCTEDGLTDGKSCSTCGDVIEKQETITASGHKPETDKKVDPTCTEKGKTEGSHCSVCNKILVRQEEIDALNHNPVTDDAVAAKCESTGLTEGSHCSVCNKVLVPQRTTRALGHDVIPDKAVPAKCESTGLTKGEHCSRCEYAVEQKIVPATGHTPETDKSVDPTCTEMGKTEGSHCSVCSKVIVPQEDVPKLEHDWGVGRITTTPTCTKDGVRTFTCSLCEDTKTAPEKMLGHDPVPHDAKRPTYTEVGWEAYETCSRCDYTTIVEIPALGEPVISTFDAFIENLAILEEITDTYVKKVSPGKDPVMLMIKYIRTGVERYNSGSWNIMAGYEDASFAKYVEKYEADYNLALEDGEELMAVTGLKNLELLTLPNGDIADIGHVFGTMDITYTNASSEDHADVAGWGGDIADLLSASDQYGLESDTLEGMVAEIDEKYFKKTGEELGNEFGEEPIEGSFSQTDANGDIDGYYIMKQIYNREYSNGVLTDIISNYMTSSLTKERRAGYFLKNRLNGVSLRTEVRDAVYNEYVTNGVIATLEGTREYQSSKEKLELIRKACCYVWADYLCRLAGDYVEIKDNNYFSVFSTESSTLAPGITQQIKLATTADNKQMKFYLATADLSNEYVSVYANYKDNNPAAGWGMARLTDQMNAAQNRYGNTESAQYIPNYNVIAGVNASGYNMSTGQPSGLLTMKGVEYSPITSAGFFAILDDGTAMIGSQQDYYTYKNRIQEAVGSFGGTPMIKDGKIVAASDTYGGSRASRAAVGITKSGKVVFMVLDGRQGDYSCGGTDAEVAQIMLEAGCVDAIHLDGGGSATYAARPEGEDAIRVVSSPSDGAERSVSSSLMMVSTAPSSTAFERAVLNCEYSYFATETSAQVTATALSATGNLVDMPEGTTWTVSDESVGSISQDGIFTALAEGVVDVNLMLDGAVIGTKKMHVVKPDNVYFEKESISAIYGQPTTLPVRAVYEGKPVKISEKDVVLSLTNEISGTLDGFKFTPAEDSGLRKTKIMAALAHDEKVTSYIDISLYRADEASFNFDEASGGDYQLAWDREVSNSTLEGTTTYRAVDMDEDMVTSYTFAIDMSKIDIPEKLGDLTYMLPGADLENASAWNFLLQLAERISVLTNVTAEFYFDEDFEVDYSELTVSNEYFKLTENGGIQFDEETNKLTLKLNWVDQTEPIDADTANPLCILSGIKLTPKDGASWTSAKVLSITNKGTISYDVYLRANALYTFAQNEENQQIFDLYPFVNPDDEEEKGGHFAAIYKLFEDGYTLINSDKDGWVIESNGYAYYHEGQRYEGIRQVDGYYYDFGEDGINVGQKKYTGDMIDEKGNEYYIRDGLLKSGWIVLDEDVRYYNPNTFIREDLEIDETPSTCIIDGYCIYKNKAGETRRVDYDDAGGHEYEKQADGSYVCSVCGHVRIEMADCTFKLTNYVYTYTGNAITPGTTVIAKDGTILTKPGQSTHPDYASEYKNNKEVGTASVTSTARKYGVYVDMTTWRGNAAGSVTATFEIRPDLPTNVTVEADKLTWTAAKAPGVTYVIYRSEDGDNWTEYGKTQDTTFTLNPAEDAAKMFRLSTEKTVDGKVYASVSQTKAVGMANMVITSVNESGKPVMKWCKAANAVSYEVYRSTTKNGTYAKVFNTVNTSYTHVSATAGRTYYYYLKTIYADGSTSQSDIVEITCIKMDAINLFTGNRESDGRPTMKWLQLKGDVKEYKVYRSTTKSGTYANVFNTEKTSYTHISATPGRTYYYKVVAVYKDGTKLESDIVSMKAKVVNIDFGLKVSNKTSGTYNGKPALSWKNTGAISYTVYRSRTQNGKYTKAFTTKGRTYTNSTAVQGVTYYYKVQAKFYDGTVVTSDIVSAKCKVVDTNLKLTASNRSNGKPALSWRQLGAKYEIYRSNTKNGTYKKVFTTEGTTYCNSSATKGRTYYYKVRAKFADGTVVWSNVLSRKCK